MKLTEHQALVLFDICKGCLYSSEKQFAGYSKEDIGKLLNDIIKQQDNNQFLSLDDNVLDNLKINNRNRIDDLNEGFWD